MTWPQSSPSYHQCWAFCGWGTIFSWWGESTLPRWMKWKDNKDWLKICLKSRKNCCCSLDTRPTKYFIDQLGHSCFSQIGVPLLSHPRHHLLLIALLPHRIRSISGLFILSWFTHLCHFKHSCPDIDHKSISSSGLLFQIRNRPFFQNSLSMLHSYRLWCCLYQPLRYEFC